MVSKPTKLFPPGKAQDHAKAVSLFTKRKQQRGVVWTDVDHGKFVQFLTLCVQENIGIGIYSASGGRGVCLKLYTGKKLPDTEYASTAEEFDELIEGVLDQLGWTADDQEESEAAD